MMIYVFDRVENIVGKGENDGGNKKEKMLISSISSFSHNVFKSSLVRVVKSCDCVV